MLSIKQQAVNLTVFVLKILAKFNISKVAEIKLLKKHNSEGTLI